MIARIIMALFFSMLLPDSYAQLRIPTFDVSVKTGYTFIDDHRSNNDGDVMYESLLLQGELNVHVNQFLALGYYYQRSAGISNYHSKNNSSTDEQARHLLHGFNARLSTGRSGKWRPYVNLKYFTLQNVINYSTFNIAYQSKGMAVGFGLMLRLSHRLYLNVIEADINKLKTPGEIVFTERNKLFPQFKAGVTYNFLKRK
jgi:hypothetical protein